MKDNFNIVFNKPTEFSKEHIVRSHYERFIKPIEDAQTRSGDLKVFPAESLSVWIELAKEANIEYIPARVVCNLPIISIFHQDEESAEQWNVIHQAIKNLKTNEMMRMDFGSGMLLKHVMMDLQSKKGFAHKANSLNTEIPNWRACIDPEDIRIFDLAFQYASESVPVLIRPWIEARMHEEAPVEYRVFVRNGQIEGVANYYYVRDLPDDARTEEEVIQIIRSATQLLETTRDKALPYRQEHDWHPDYFEPNEIHCTMDFLVDRDGKVLFLEAGPAFGAGAHPCAFAGHSKIKPVGVALSASQPAKDLAPYIQKAREVQIKPPHLKA